MKDTAFSAKTQPVPITAISTPAIAGPISRAAFRDRMLRPAALAIREGPTSSVTKESRAGFSTVNTQPSAKDSR